MRRKPNTIEISNAGGCYLIFLKMSRRMKPQLILSTTSISTLADVVSFYGLMFTSIDDKKLFDAIKKEMHVES